MSSRVKWSSVLAFVPSQDRLTGRMGLSNGYKSSKQISKQLKDFSIDIIYVYSEVWHESAEISEDPVYVF